MTSFQMGHVEVRVTPTTTTDITNDVVRQITELLGPGWDDKAKHDVWASILNGMTRAQSIMMKAGSNGDYPRHL